MNTFTEILKYILPSLVVLAAAWYIISAFFRHDKEMKHQLEHTEIRKSVLPVRLQAYERLMLLLERLQPAGLILRISSPGMNARELQSALLLAVREEFEHNLSQQLYVSAEAWEKVKDAREACVMQINHAMNSLPPEAPAGDLARQILVADAGSVSTELNAAIIFLKAEAVKNFF